MSSVCLLISSPSSYRDAFNISSDLFTKYWKDCPYKKIYATDFLEVELDGSDYDIIVTNEKDDWMTRMNFVLDKIQTEYVILLTDDLFIKKKINNQEISKLMNYIYENKILYTRLFKNNNFKKKQNKIESSYFKLKYNQSYARSLLGGIWNKEFLMSTLRSNTENAWSLEEEWNKEGLARNNEYISQHLYFHNDYFFHAIYKGMWFRSVKRFLKTRGIALQSNRKSLSITNTILIIVKKKFRDLLTPKSKYIIKKLLKRFIKIDTKY